MSGAAGTEAGRSGEEREFNYFNYYTEVEEYFWKKRGAHLLVSPLDWAIVETWQKAGVPLAAVLRGIDTAFESYGRSRRGAAGRQMKSLAYCMEAVLDAAEELREAATGGGTEAGARAAAAEAGFSREDIRAYMRGNAEKLRAAAGRAKELVAAGIAEAAGRLGELEGVLDAPGKMDLEDLERRLTVVEERLHAVLLAHGEEERLVRIRGEMERALAAYGRKMTAEQLGMLGRQYMQKRLFEEYGVVRVSLFYM